MANLTFEIPSGIQWIVYLIVVDVILGIVAAIVKKEFRLGKLAKFMGVPVLGYVFGYVVLVNIFGYNKLFNLGSTVFNRLGSCWIDFK
jgi:MFS superfamily sulfate permease-like transporter